MMATPHGRKEDVPGGIQTALLEEQEREKAWHFDKGKPQFELIPQWGLLELAKVAEYGKRKYGKHNYAEYADNWNWLEPAGSILRHTFAFLRGEWYDDESGLAHLAHAAFNALMLIDLRDHDRGNDDRSPLGDQIKTPVLEPLPMLAVDGRTPNAWRNRIEELNRDAMLSIPIDGMDSWHTTLSETPEDVEDAQIEINKAWSAKVDGLLTPEEIPEEELHDDLTFPPFAPEVTEYWRNKLANEAKEIVCGS